MMKLRLTVYCYRTYFHGACAPNLSLYLYLSLTACQNTVKFIKNIYQYVRVHGECAHYGTLAHSLTQSYTYRIKHKLKRKPDKSLTSGGFRGDYIGERR